MNATSAGGAAVGCGEPPWQRPNAQPMINLIVLDHHSVAIPPNFDSKLFRFPARSHYDVAGNHQIG
jgi:hypothetical protein